MSRYFAWFGLPGSLVLTLLLLLFALCLAVLCGGADRWICFFAMILSSCGDIFLMNLDFIRSWFENYFVIGAAFFMVSHLVYLTAKTFIDCIRNKKQPELLFNVYSAGVMASTAILAHRSMLENGKTYDIPDFH